MKNTTCPVCKVGVSKDIGPYNDMLYGHSGEWKLLRCDICKHECISPLPSQHMLESFYSLGSYYSFNTRTISNVKKFFRSITRRLLPKDLQGKRFVDYGCGDGEVLLLASEAGARVFGIEFGKTVEFLKRDTGFDICENPPSDWYGSMDYVRSFHSFEHITDPIKVLEMFKALVVPESGRILIGVPNVDSWVAKLFGKYYFYRGVPLHLHGYSLESMKLLGKACGLDLVSISTPGAFRGILGSISLMFQSILFGRSREPSTATLCLMFPLYIFLFPIVIAGNFFKKGDVMEVIFKRPNE